uniref:Uncharacterized protein n=1 Tax=Glossina pallidipes TaxID=7398 RepID=A0A1A9ZTU0_GLOPL
MAGPFRKAIDTIRVKNRSSIVTKTRAFQNLPALSYCCLLPLVAQEVRNAEGACIGLRGSLSGRYVNFMEVFMQVLETKLDTGNMFYNPLQRHHQRFVAMKILLLSLSTIVCSTLRGHVDVVVKMHEIENKGVVLN